MEGGILLCLLLKSVERCGDVMEECFHDEGCFIFKQFDSKKQTEMFPFLFALVFLPH